MNTLLNLEPNDLKYNFMLRADSYQMAIQLKQVLTNHFKETDLDCYEIIGEEMYFDGFPSSQSMSAKDFIKEETDKLMRWYKEEMEKHDEAIHFNTTDEMFIIQSVLSKHSRVKGVLDHGIVTDVDSNVCYYDTQCDVNMLIPKKEWGEILDEVRTRLSWFAQLDETPMVVGFHDKLTTDEMAEWAMVDHFIHCSFAVPMKVFRMAFNTKEMSRDNQGRPKLVYGLQPIGYDTNPNEDEKMLLDSWDFLSREMMLSKDFIVLRK